MYGILLVIHVIISVALIGLILIQQGKGAQAGAAFGSGASQTIFGSQGSGGFLSRTTGILAALFFAINLIIACMVNRARVSERPNMPSSFTQEADQTSPAQEKSPASPDVPAVDE